MATKSERRAARTALAKSLGLPNPSRFRDFSEANIIRYSEGTTPVASPGRPAIRTETLPLVTQFRDYQASTPFESRDEEWGEYAAGRVPPTRDIQRYLSLAPDEYNDKASHAYAYARFVFGYNHEDAVDYADEAIEDALFEGDDRYTRND